ncbi:hypothetical protein HZS_1182, partial [Henneguya salminicola]
MIQHGHNIFVGFSQSRNILMVTYDYGVNWKEENAPEEEVKEILMSSQNSNYIALVDTHNSIYIIKPLKKLINLQSEYGTQLMWSSTSDYLYFLSGFFKNQPYLLKTSYNTHALKILLEGVVKYGEIGDIIWAITKKGTKSKLYFIYSDDKVQKASFPDFLKPIDFYVTISNSNIFTIVINETNNILLYSASSKDLRFVRIVENIRIFYNASIKICIDVETFDTLPGVLIMNIETRSEGYDKIFTAISYNNGIKWTYIIPPKKIHQKSCVWPSCYLKLQLECQIYNQKNSIKFSEMFPSLMTSFGTIYKNGVEDYSGLFLSVDAGYSWEPIPSSINSVHILDYGSVLLGLPKFLQSIYFSYDIGHTWKYLSLVANSLMPLKIFYDPSADSLLTTIIALDDTLKEWNYVIIKFSEAIQKNCERNDYEIYTHSAHDRSSCFQGQKEFTYRRKHEVKCKSLLNILPQIPSDICPCTRDDFGCTFGNYFINGRCLRDPDYNSETVVNTCIPGEFLLKPSGMISHAYKIKEQDSIKHCVKFLSMIGEMKSNLCYDVPINTVARDWKNKHYVIYLDGLVSKVDDNYNLIENVLLKNLEIQKVTKTHDILEAYVNGNEEYFITKNACEIDELLCDQDSKCVTYSDICDGIKNCEDGKDELNCHAVSKCNKDQYRCLNGDCIDRNKYCDKIKDCPDYSDEESCQPGCKYFERMCKNGQCVMKNQICDNNFDCADLSDEHGCEFFIYKNLGNLIVDAVKNMSCLIKCDNKCIPHDNICNHITDCSDGKDEIDCSNFYHQNIEYKYVCSSKDMRRCHSDFICYEIHRKCDEFTDCLDGSDELNCKKIDFCSKTDIFQCDSMQKCISINNYCDGKKDCADKSDEGLQCIVNNYIQSINIKNMINGNLELNWVSYKNIKPWYNVSFIANENNISFSGKIITDNFIKINGLTNCNKYTAIVKKAGSNIGRILQFTYKSSHTKSPTALHYDYSRSLLYWNYVTDFCIPNIFYIECVNLRRIVLQNFSTINYLVIRNSLKLTCYVSACPLNVFNISCSSYSSIIYLEYYSCKVLTIIIQ